MLLGGSWGVGWGWGLLGAEPAQQQQNLSNLPLDISRGPGVSQLLWAACARHSEDKKRDGANVDGWGDGQTEAPKGKITLILFIINRPNLLIAALTWQPLCPVCVSAHPQHPLLVSAAVPGGRQGSGDPVATSRDMAKARLSTGGSSGRFLPWAAHRGSGLLTIC